MPVAQRSRLILSVTLGNYSSGKMGHALAEAARDRGAEVVLVTASSLGDPYGVKTVPCRSSGGDEEGRRGRMPRGGRPSNGSGRRRL